MSNGASAATAAEVVGSAAGSVEVEAIAAAPRADTPVLARVAWDLAEQWESCGVAGEERAVLRGEEMDRFEARLGGKSGERFTGYVRLGNGLAALPVGSQLDAETGWFTWAPGAGLVGTYELVFVRWSGRHAVAGHDLRVILAPKGSRRPASTLWAPSRRTTVSPSPQRSAW